MLSTCGLYEEKKTRRRTVRDGRTKSCLTLASHVKTDNIKWRVILFRKKREVNATAALSKRVIETLLISVETFKRQRLRATRNYELNPRFFHKISFSQSKKKKFFGFMENSMQETRRCMSLWLWLEVLSPVSLSPRSVVVGCRHFAEFVSF